MDLRGRYVDMDDSNEGSDVSYDPLNDAELTSYKWPQAKRKTGRTGRGSILERHRQLRKESDDGIVAYVTVMMVQTVVMEEVM